MKLEVDTLLAGGSTGKRDGFVHLHTHTEYSMLVGAAKLDEHFTSAIRLGQEALSITDHGYLFGAFDFWNKAQQYGIKPIIGMEAYLAPGHQHRTDKSRVRWGDPDQRGDDVSGSGAYTPMTLLSKNNTGMHTQFRMGSHASLDAVYAKWPRIDRELLNDYSEGIIAKIGRASCRERVPADGV